MDGSPFWSGTLTAARVVDDSAHPIIRANDLVLIEQVVPITTEAVDRLEGRLVATVVTAGSESYGFLKRMGPELGHSVRLLERIGMTGSSVTVGLGNGNEIPLTSQYVLERLWRLNGFLRSEALTGSA